MAFDRFLIAPLTTGLQLDLRPWLTPEDSFQKLINAFVFRGRVRKRTGSQLMGATQLNSRLRIPLEGGAAVGITDAGGNASGTVPGHVFAVGQLFSIGSTIYTVVTAGAVQPMLKTDATVTATYSTTNGAYNFVGAPPLTQIYFYPALPVMGLTVYEKGPINNQPSIAFDTEFAYIFIGGQWQRTGDAAHGNAQWHGTDLNFFWTDNWQGITSNVVALFVTNFFVTNPNGIGTANDDPIWYATGPANALVWTPVTGANGFYFRPAGGAIHTGPFVQTARIIVAFKNRLLLLNTIENDNSGGFGNNINYVNRCRYSHNGSPLSVNAWYEPNQIDAAGNVADGAGFIDAPTEEEIVSAEFIKDRLIVFFQNSTWELVYTGSEVLPFVWQKINTELGSESTFSSVPFDKEILSIGNVGVHACNGANVERIDTKIPDEIFDIKNANSGIKRVWGIRDYFLEIVYWIFAASDTISTYPNQMLIYNYRNQTWALFDDSFTALGYFQQQSDVTWATAQATWEQYNSAWNSGVVQQQFRQIIAGNQEGFVLILEPDIDRNAPSLQITNITYVNGIGNSTVTVTIINHNISDGSFVIFENIQGVFGLNGHILAAQFVDANTIRVVILGSILTGIYTGGGTVALVSNINILSKQWNPYINKGRDFYLARIDFCVEKTTNGQITVDYYPSATSLSMIEAGEGTGSIMGNSILETSPYALYPLEAEQDRLWHPIYFQTDGEFVQIFFYFSDDQIMKAQVAFSPFELEGLILHTQATRQRLE